ncbi:MAG TPA: hypothetical protein VEF76_12810 [Patescibacteria group bacterium]|nr:hypothetical protein [Patescibacteria group bacterium]
MTLRRLGKLAKIFTKAVVGISLTATLSYAGFVEGAYNGKGEKLTPAEKQVVEQIFGDEVDAGKIRKHFKENSHWTHFLKSKQGTVMPFTHHVDFFGENIRSADYGRDDAYKYGFFLHEMTHIWQGANLKYPLKNFGEYEYKLTPESKFSDFGIEQQGEIIEAYAKAWHHPEGRRQPKTAADRLLIHVVETRFPQARITRQRLERQEAQPQLVATVAKPAR